MVDALSRTPAPATLARCDAILAVLRVAEGFPLSTGEIARSLGMKQTMSGQFGGHSEGGGA